MVDKHAAKFREAHRHSMALAHIDRARHTTSNGGGSGAKMQEALHLPDALPAGLRWRERLKGWWYRLKREWEPVTVNKSIDSVTMPKWIASAILVAVLSFGAASWWRSSDQRDMLIELRTELRIAKE